MLTTKKDNDAMHQNITDLSSKFSIGCCKLFSKTENYCMVRA